MDEMISCNLQGGLGNLLFQISAAHSLAISNNDISCFNISTTTGIQHKNPIKYISNIFRNLNHCTVANSQMYNEPKFSYSPIPYKENLTLNGYFQSEKYFKNNRSEILKLFNILDVDKTYIENKYSSILKNSVSVHVRRGDYLYYPNVHPTQSNDYYNKALQTINPDNILIFSDDLNWCKNNFKTGHFIHEDDVISLYLMSYCTNNIICNSSFSWWGAWLNQKDNKKVIAPTSWFGKNGPQDYQDIYCQDWTIL